MSPKSPRVKLSLFPALILVLDIFCQQLGMVGGCLCSLRAQGWEMVGSDLPGPNLPQKIARGPICLEPPQVNALSTVQCTSKCSSLIHTLTLSPITFVSAKIDNKSSTNWMTPSKKIVLLNPSWSKDSSVILGFNAMLITEGILGDI